MPGGRAVDGVLVALPRGSSSPLIRASRRCHRLHLGWTGVRLSPG